VARRQRPFPRKSLEEAASVPRSLKEYNGGNAWPPAEVAKALGSTAKSTTFFYLTSASRDYGFTEGTRDASTISLTDLGRELVYPDSADREMAAFHSAFRSVESFAAVLDHFGGSNLPEKRYLSNTLESEFTLDPSWHDEFLDIFRANCKFLGISDSYDRATFSPAERTTGGIEKADGGGTQTIVHVEGGPVCFVVMPFVERYDHHEAGFFEEVLRSVHTPALEAAGFEVRTALRTGSDVIQATILKELLGADLVLADLTEHNPNVLFELGLRIAEERPIALVKAKGTGRVFDVDNMLRCVEYSPNLWPTTLATDVPAITSHVMGAWDGRNTDPTFLSILRAQSLQTG